MKHEFIIYYLNEKEAKAHNYKPSIWTPESPVGDLAYIMRCDDYGVYPYIGRTDRDGKKLYEGSLLEWHCEFFEVYFDVNMLKYSARGDNGRLDISFYAKDCSLVGHIAEGNHE